MDATTETAIITAWWALWPEALIGMPTARLAVDATVIELLPMVVAAEIVAVRPLVKVNVTPD